MAGYTLRILSVQEEPRTENELFSVGKERFSLSVYTIQLSDLLTQAPEDLSNKYDVIVIDRRRASPTIPQYLSVKLRECRKFDIDILILIAERDFTLFEILEEYNASGHNLNYLLEPINQKEFDAVMQRKVRMGQLKQFLDETDQIAKQLSDLGALQDVKDGADYATIVMRSVLTSVCRAAVQMFGVEHSGCVVFDRDDATGKYKDRAITVADFPDFAENPILNSEIQVKGVYIEEQLLRDKEVIEVFCVRDEPKLGSVRDHLSQYDIQSILLVPVIVDDVVKASFSLDAIGHTHSFSENDKELCKKLALQVGVIISRIEKEQETRAITASWEAARDITRTASQGDVDNTMSCIVQAIVRKLNAEIASLYIYDDDPEVDRFVAHYFDGCAKASVVEPHLANNYSSLYRIKNLEGTDYYYSDDAPNDLHFRGQFVEKEKVTTAFGMRLTYGNRFVGALFINYRKRKQLKSYEIEAFRSFGQQAAVAIKTILLNEQSQRSRKMLDSLYAAGDFYEGDENTEKALLRIVQVAHQALNAQGVSDNLVSHLVLVKGNRLSFEAAWPEENLARLKMIEPEINLDPEHPCTFVSKAILEGKTQLEQNASGLDYYVRCFPEVNAQISVPLKVGETIIGALSVEKRTPPLISQQDKSLLEHLASHATTVIQANRHLLLINSLLSAWSGIQEFHDSESDQSNYLLFSIAQAVRTIFSCDQVGIFSYDEERKEIAIPAVISGVQKEVSAFYETLMSSVKKRIALTTLDSSSAIRNLIEGGVDVFANDVRNNPILGLSQTVQREDLASAAGILLKIKGNNHAKRCLGVMFLNFRTPHKFSKEEQQEINLFAQSIAYALENVHISKKLANMQSYIEEQSWITRGQKYWSDKMSECINSIESTVQLIDHELELYPQDRKKVKELREQLSNISVYNADIARIIEVPDQGLGRKKDKVEVRELVYERFEAIWKHEWDNLDYQRVHPKNYVDISASPVIVQVDEEWLRYVIDLVVDIAVDRVQSASKKEVEIDVVLHRDRKQVQIIVVDSAKVKPDNLEKELSKNIQWRVAKTIMRANDGNLEFEYNNEHLDSCTYTLTLPVIEILEKRS